jgi:SEC-C motif-containing protein
MRSRYSAYTLGDLAYLRATWHPDFRPPDLALEPGMRWIGLEIRAFEPGETAARVEFEARFLARGRVDAVHEFSSFILEQGKWMYTDGEMLPSSFAPWKPARNEACPCGSGKKYKRCCAQH